MNIIALIPLFGLVMVVLVIVLARRLGHEWEVAGKFLGPAAVLFVCSLAVLPLPLLEKDPASAQETAVMICVWAGVVGWILLVLGAGIMASSNRES